MNKLDAFTTAYLVAMLWSTNDESDESGGQPMDANYSIEDLAPEALAEAICDCSEFREKAGLAVFSTEWTDEQAGHDFWLTRAGHGCGFWDGDYPTWGDQLTELCKSFGEMWPYIGDDGKVYT